MTAKALANIGDSRAPWRWCPSSDSSFDLLGILFPGPLRRGLDVAWPRRLRRAGARLAWSLSLRVGRSGVGGGVGNGGGRDATRRDATRRGAAWRNSGRTYPRSFRVLV